VFIDRISPWAPMRMSPINFEGSYIAFYPHIFDGTYPQGNFSWHHLWFVAYLLVYSLVSLPIVLFLKRSGSGRRLAARFADVFARPSTIFVLAVPIVLAELLLSGRFPSTHALIDDWANHAHYLLVFLYGCVLVGDPRFAQAVDRVRSGALAAGLVLTTTLIVGAFVVRKPSTTLEIVGAVLYCGGQWCWLIAIVGYGRAYLDRPNRILRHTAKIAYPFYILHQTVIVVIAYYVVQWEAGVAAKFVVVSTGALIVTTLLCELVRLTNVTRALFGMPRLRVSSASTGDRS
jgi:peptidoglycan/LPS O-acetylase OafA/YrhL